MNHIKHGKKDMLKAFLPKYIAPWIVFSIAIFLFTLIEFGNENLFSSFLINVGCLFTGIVLMIISFSMVVNGLSYKITDRIIISENETVIDLPVLTNFRDESKFCAPILNQDILIMRDKCNSVDFDKTLDSIGLSCKITDNNGDTIPSRVSAFDSKDFVITIKADKREDLKKARKMILTTQKNLDTKIKYNNNAKF